MRGRCLWLRRILHTLSVRYGLDMIYTYSSNILIAVRTFVNLLGLRPIRVQIFSDWCFKTSVHVTKPQVLPRSFWSQPQPQARA